MADTFFVSNFGVSKLKIDNKVIEEISKIIAEYATGSEITRLFNRLDFYDYDLHHPENRLSTKWKRLSHSIIEKCNKERSERPFFRAIEEVLNPIYFQDAQEAWYEANRKVNFPLRFYGFEIDDSGKIMKTIETKTYSEAVSRSQNLLEKIEPYNIHNNVIKFCRPELLQKNYFHAIHEASKSTLNRIRDMNNCSADGARLIELSFSTKNPSLIIKGNKIQSEKDRNEYNALKHLLLTINYFYRNTTAHEAKVYNPKSETDAITALTLISKAHDLLDNCECVRYFEN
jgi:uncharacterized protein (TIGR02391 family)